MFELVRIRSMAALLTLCACSADAEKAESNLDCAALISAVSQFSLTGQLDPEPDFESEALASSMMYLNAHAIPNGLREAEAFSRVKARRAELNETVSPLSISARAEICMANTPGR